MPKLRSYFVLLSAQEKYVRQVSCRFVRVCKAKPCFDLELNSAVQARKDVSCKKGIYESIVMKLIKVNGEFVWLWWIASEPKIRQLGIHISNERGLLPKFVK